MGTKELIEKQIEEAAEHFDAMIEAPKFTHAWGKAVEGCCGNLLRAVQNQQAQIEELQRRLGDPRAPVTLGEVDEIIERAKARLPQKGKR